MTLVGFGADFWCVPHWNLVLFTVVSQIFLNVDVLSTYEFLKDGWWKVAFSPYYDLWILESNKCCKCDKKHSEGLFGSFSSSSGVEKEIWQISSGDDFNLHDQPRLGRPSVVNEDELPENEVKISTEKVAKRLKIDISTAFYHLKRRGFKKNGWFRKIENVSFSTTTFLFIPVSTEKLKWQNFDSL